MSVENFRAFAIHSRNQVLGGFDVDRCNMDPRRKKSLTAARYDLSKNLMSTQSVCDFLISRGELTDSLAEEIMAQATRDKQNSKLCQIIGARGKSAYDNFRLALVETEAPSFLLEKLPDYSTVSFD